jgi:hypothetical protein
MTDPRRKEFIMSAPTYIQPPDAEQQRKRSRRTLWIILGVVGASIVIGSITFSLLVATGVITALNTLKHTGPTPVRYYLNIVEQDYAQAYTNLDSSATINGQPVDQQAFTTLVNAADAQKGKVTGFIIKDGSDPSHVTLTVYRGGQSYDVHLVLKLENGDWKIISADGI